MPETRNENFWSAEKENIPSALESAANVPPPPPEVKIRTFASDLESMAESGGGRPVFRTVRAPSLAAAGGEKARNYSGRFWTIAIIVIAAGILAGVGFLAYSLLSGGPASVPPAQTEQTRQIPSGAATSSATPPVSPSPGGQTPQAASSFVTRTFFVKPVDETSELVIRRTITSAADLQTFNQKLKGALSGAGATSTFLEVDVKDSSGNQLGLNDVFSLADLWVLDPQFFSAHFSPYLTVFVYRDKNGFWPGYVLELKPTENWLFLQPDVVKLETSAKIGNFFLNPPGASSAGGFKDETISAAPARALNFAAPGASFIYLWSRGYLILGTSADGIKEALSRL